ncbi:MAG: histidine kinase [Bacteroidetes bacterium]|nr:histidine kinase [Bacteroidota bacterium]MCH8940895.1 histidine kinase [Bacteroidota bacterium]
MNDLEEKNIHSFDDFWVEQVYGNRIQDFQNLMRLRIRDILLVSSLYDLYLFEEDGRLYELIRNEYQDLSLSQSPELTRVSSGKEALQLASQERRFDLIITTLHIEDMNPIYFAKLVKESSLDIPVVLLAHDNKELKYLLINKDIDVFDQIFIWQGDFRIMIGIVKYLEDKLNLDHDCRSVGVQIIIIIEDDIKQYSSFLPFIYNEIHNQSQKLISEGINLTHKFLRMRARPKIILCTNYEEAWEYYKKYQNLVLGVISDIEFPHNGKDDPIAGIKIAENIKKSHSDIPVLLLSENDKYKSKAEEIGASFLLKTSPHLFEKVRKFINNNLGFGDFIFTNKDGKKIAKASNLRELEQQLKVIPVESIKFHAEKNHFSNWLKARTEFYLAHQLRRRKVSDFASLEELRNTLIQSLRTYRKQSQRGIITDFKKESFDPQSSFARIGGGSLGGKARGLGFLNWIINNNNLREQFENINIYVPPAVVLTTEVFDLFIEENHLSDFLQSSEDDIEIFNKFINTKKFPRKIKHQLEDFLELMKTPLAVRSSSLLEDSQYHPFAGVYKTYMIPNNHPNPRIRLEELILTIKKVYASTYSKAARDYINLTSYRLEEEKMAVIIQKMIGKNYNNKFYPDFAGVAKSHNFYPLPPQKQTDGIVSVALGLGKTVVEGGNTVRFCPKYPTDLILFYSITDSLNNSQRDFYALPMDKIPEEEFRKVDEILKKYKIDEAEKDGTLNLIASTYSAENDMITDGLSRSGPRVITFAPILKHGYFPLTNIMKLLLELGSWGMGTPIELEFAVNMSSSKKEFGLLQMRPFVLNYDEDELNVDEFSNEDLICYSEKVMGNGLINDVFDIVLVDFNIFERTNSREVADEVTYFNSKLVADKRPYLLIGVGRWGTKDPWLGIPVNWEQIAGARAIIESSFKDISVEPSQGSHFFHNIISFSIAYLSIDLYKQNGLLDWEWLLNQHAEEKKNYTRLLNFENPIIIKMNGKKNKGIVIKPGISYDNN